MEKRKTILLIILIVLTIIIQFYVARPVAVSGERPVSVSASEE